MVSSMPLYPFLRTHLSRLNLLQREDILSTAKQPSVEADKQSTLTSKSKPEVGKPRDVHTSIAQTLTLANRSHENLGGRLPKFPELSDALHYRELRGMLPKLIPQFIESTSKYIEQVSQQKRDFNGGNNEEAQLEISNIINNVKTVRDELVEAPQKAFIAEQSYQARLLLEGGSIFVNSNSRLSYEKQPDEKGLSFLESSEALSKLLENLMNDYLPSD